MNELLKDLKSEVDRLIGFDYGSELQHALAGVKISTLERVIDKPEKSLKAQWQPIETAPRYQFILGYCKEAADCKGAASEINGCMIICIRDNQIIDSLGIVLNWRFTHWQPLPTPPTNKP